MNNFKAGDKVKRLTTGVEDWGVFPGSVYTVRTIHRDFSLSLVESPNYTFDPLQFEIVDSRDALVDVLREQYPIVYDDLVSMGRFDLKPREDVYEVTIRVPKDNRETEQSIRDYLEDYVNEVPGQRLVRVQKVEG